MANLLWPPVVLGGVATAVLRRATVPLLPVRPSTLRVSGGTPSSESVAAFSTERFSHRKLTMQKTILVPLDGSPLAEHALPHATALAHALDARVILAHAACTIDQMRNQEVRLDNVVERIRATGVAAEPLVCHRDGDQQAGRAILAAAADKQVDLIVMATHGHGGLGRLLYGSVADQVLRHATLPVLFVSPSCKAPWPGDRPLRVLVTLDGSDLSEAVLRPLSDLVRPLSAELILLRVLETIDFVKPHGDECAVCRAARARGQEPDIEPVRARRYVEDVAARLRSNVMRVEAEMHIGHSTSTIVKVADECEVDVIAMATHGRGGLARALMGSVATDTLRRASVPLLLVRLVPQHGDVPASIDGGRTASPAAQPPVAVP